LAQDDVGIDHEVMSLPATKLGVFRIPYSRQYRLETGEALTQVTVLEPARNIIPDISFPQNCASAIYEALKPMGAIQLRTFPFAVFFKNLCCARGASARVRLRIVMGG
jgi:hypothetical protein